MEFNLSTSAENLAFIINAELIDFENDIDKMIPLKNVRTKDIDYLLESYGLRYYDLPQSLKNKIDEIDLVD